LFFFSLLHQKNELEDNETITFRLAAHSKEQEPFHLSHAIQGLILHYTSYDYDQTIHIIEKIYKQREEIEDQP
jgi:hypothetical protein